MSKLMNKNKVWVRLILSVYWNENATTHPVPYPMNILPGTQLTNFQFSENIKTKEGKKRARVLCSRALNSGDRKCNKRGRSCDLQRCGALEVPSPSGSAGIVAAVPDQVRDSNEGGDSGGLWVHRENVEDLSVWGNLLKPDQWDFVILLWQSYYCFKLNTKNNYYQASL